MYLKKVDWKVMGWICLRRYIPAAVVSEHVYKGSPSTRAGMPMG
jgi:hypothetical protein